MPLSNSTASTLSTAPYYDDYYTQNTATGQFNGQEFDFHRILFRPRYGVQVRELTQLQTLLQAQLERLGQAQFRNGDRVFGGQLTLNLKAHSGQVTSGVSLQNFFDRDANVGKEIKVNGTNPEVRSKVLQYLAVDDGGTSNNYLIYGDVLGGAFNPGNTIVDRGNNDVAIVFSSGSDVFHNASLVSIDEGVCFVSGMYVRIRPQTIVLDALSNTPSYHIGFVVNEEILDEYDDVVGDSLGDPANQGAPGANRLRVRLQLAKRAIGAVVEDSFVTLGTVINGVMQTVSPKSKYITVRELDEVLARRTYDESGDYITRAFSPVLEGSASANDTNSQAVTDFVLSLGAGKAYVQGYEIETTDATRLTINKSRTDANVTNGSLAATVGNYTYVTRLLADNPTNYFANIGTVDLHCVSARNIQSGNSSTANAASYAFSRIGTARVRMLESGYTPEDITAYANAESYISDTNYKLFFFDTQFDSISGNITTATYNATTTKTSIVINTSGVSGQDGANGVPRVEGALNGVSISLGGTSPGIYTIESSTPGAGPDMTLTLKEFVSSLPANDTPYRLLFQPRDVDSFAVFSATANAAAPFSPYLAFQADVAPIAKDNKAPTGYTKIYAPNDNSLVYEIPESFLVPNSVDTTTAEYTTWTKSNTVLSGTGTSNVNITLGFADISEFSLPEGNLNAGSAAKTFVIFDVTNDDAGRGFVVNFSDSANSTNRCITDVDVDTDSVTFTYHHGASISSARSFIAVGRGTVTGHGKRVKTLYLGNTTTAFVTSNALFNGQIEYHTPNTTPGFAYSFKTADVFNLKKVLYKSSNTSFANTDLATATDVTSYFTLDDGQRDNTYEYSRAIVKRGAGSVIASTGRLLFIFDWFDHSGTGYAFLDSYLGTSNVSKGFTYEDVPNFTSPKTGRTVSLRNVIDFRPVRSNYEFRNTALQLSSSNTSVNTGYLTAESTGKPYLMPASDRDWEAEYSYYLSRTDRVTLTNDGQFHVVEGQPAVKPVPPTIDAASMLLYELYVPGYTLVDDTGKPTNVRLKTFDHKRYTMQDLVKVEDRVAHLEYYTALSQLERSARDQSILDDDNQERFKNGIVVDNFAGTDVADVKRPDWAASIDTANQRLRPAFRYAGDTDGEYSFDFSADMTGTNSTGITRIGDMAIPSYTEQPFITQSLATHAVSVNPFNISNFYGSMKLVPAVDTGKSIAPAQVLDMGGPSQAWLDAEYPSYTNWGEWETTWTGTPKITTRHEWWVPDGWSSEDHPWRSQLVTTFEDAETEARQQRTGTQFFYESVPTTQSLGNIIVDTSVVHSIRRRDVVFSAAGLKPNTVLYPYFDGTSIQEYVQQANVLRLSDTQGANTVALRNLKMGDTIYVKKPLTGTVSTTSGVATITGVNTKFSFELVAGQFVEIAFAGDKSVRYIANVASNTSASLSASANVTWSGATLSTLTPVTIADIVERTYTTDGVVYSQFTLKVVRAQRDASIDDIVPYAIQAGSLSPAKLVNDAGSSTAAATVLVNDITSNGYAISAATIRSGVARAYDSASHTLRLDNDAPATSDTDIPVDTVIYFVGGPGAGQQSIIRGYDSGTQTITLDSTITLTNITPGRTIYSLGALRADGFLPAGTANSGGYSTTSLSPATVTAFAGSAAGVVHLQENQFPVGNRVFLLMDNATNNLSDATTRADATYTAAGIRFVEQPTSITTRNIVRSSRGVTDARNTVFKTTSIVDTEWVDPLAQSFLVDAKAYPLGVFITSLDLVFAEKPPIEDETPVSVELRPMVNGYPSSVDVLPCVASSGKAIATLRPIHVNIVANPSFASGYTRFTFPAPIHLIGGQEYAIVIRSNSDKYKVYTAQISQPVIGGNGSIVSAQPYAGSFFKSQNASTWTAEQNEDLMFRVNRATWATPTSATLVLRATPFTTDASYDSITLYPYECAFGNATSIGYELSVVNESDGATRHLVVYPDQTYVLPERALSAGRQNRYPRIVSALNATDTYVNGDTYDATSSLKTIDATITLSTTSPDVAPYIDVEKASAIGVRHLINNLPLYASQFEIVDRGSNYANTAALIGSVTTTAGNTIVTGSGTTFTSTLIAGRDVVIGGNLAITVASIVSDTQFIARTAPAASRSANTYATYPTVSLTITSSTGSGATGYAIVSAASTSNVSGVVTGVALDSEGSGYHTSPSIAVSGNSAIVYRGEDWTTGGNALSRYMIKPVTLADGFEARDIKVYFDAYRPKGTAFYVYYRILPGTADTATLNDQSWRLMTQDTNDATISVRPNQYREFEFSTPESLAADAATDTTSQFKTFAVKVVMASNNTAQVPAIKNLRIIALDE